jgi:hypothetical protein
MQQLLVLETKFCLVVKKKECGLGQAMAQSQEARLMA